MIQIPHHTLRLSGTFAATSSRTRKTLNQHPDTRATSVVLPGPLVAQFSTFTGLSPLTSAIFHLHVVVRVVSLIHGLAEVGKAELLALFVSRLEPRKQELHVLLHQLVSVKTQQHAKVGLT